MASTSEPDKPRTIDPPISWLDNQFRNFGIAAKLFVPVVGNGLGLLLGIIGLCFCRDAFARSNAWFVTIFSAIVTIVGIIWYLNR